MMSPLRDNLPLYKSSGIYIITNTENGKIYVGSATSIRGRLLGHRSKLRLKKHENPHLQHAWNKYGEGSFLFSVAETCSIPQLLEREQYYIDTFQSSNPDIGYNIALVAGTCMSGRNHTDKSKKQMSDKRQGWDTSKATEAVAKVNKGKARSQETKDKIGKKHKGKVVSEETKKKMRDNHWTKFMSKEEVSKRNKKAAIISHRVKRAKMFPNILDNDIDLEEEDGIMHARTP